MGVTSLVIQSAQSEYAQSTYVVSGVAALRTELAFNRKVGLHITPQYNIPVMQGPIATSIRRDSSDINAWNNGFALTAGLWINLFSK